MIGKIVKYKGLPDMHYIVIDFSPKTNEYGAEICIIQDFLFEGDITKQVKIWQPIERFEIVEEG